MKNIILIVFSFFVFSCAEVYQPAVVSARKEATQIGLEIMKNGGNAYDAMIATHLALAVVHPTAGNIGGGGFFVYRDQDGSSGTLDFREMAPGSAYKDMYLDIDGNVIPDMSTLGGAAVGVPGSISAIFEIHSKFGSLPIEELFRPAIDLSNNGYVVTEKQSNSLTGKLEDFIKINGNESLYSKRYFEGDTIKNIKFAETLKKISEFGPKAFYEGEIADMIVRDVKKSGGIMTVDDLKNYKSVWRDPVKFKYKDLEVISMSLPSSGGILIGQILKSIEDYDIKSFGHNSVEAVQLMVELERRAYADRSHFMGDPDFMNLPVYELIDKNYVNERMKNFSWDKATPSSEVKHGNIIINESDETTHYSIIDKYGNSVSVTTTLNNSYGSKVFVEEGGFFLNNEMDDFSSKPGYPNFYGLIGSEANSIKAGKRMLSSMTPTIVLKNNKPSLIVGTPGGSTIITSVLQTILNVYEFDMDIQDAVNAPRFHHQWLPDVVIFEEGGLDKVKDSILKSKNYFVISLPIQMETGGMSPRSSIGAVDAIFIDEKGNVSTGADFRGDDYGEILK
ncbi:MAG: gamma-glutamyltransferase [Cryomorphaceae bacterium]|jgi:gamma-glutamyltranspeptidase/glutathione hydrolase|nr:gamma-glutamyltransferase [Cryomorphaceae bacterium]MBT3684369.1 gamma-glutamyltransferase [Cryomorphaceae bacterium]MBT4236842.1 gamma-glutamyltransferase [Cryomorphaceae bacterium]MBT4813893.1 gamma-glutamyltransferase [Cryomorphaceae bacterium]MBT5417215.1 gamma-glutamyltransferase [Cryomorphaceae bacterium]